MLSLIRSRPHGLGSTRLLCPWDSPGKNTRGGCHALLQGIFPTQEWNPGLLHWQANSLPLSQFRSSGYNADRFPNQAASPKSCCCGCSSEKYHCPARVRGQACCTQRASAPKWPDPRSRRKSQCEASSRLWPLSRSDVRLRKGSPLASLLLSWTFLCSVFQPYHPSLPSPPLHHPVSFANLGSSQVTLFQSPSLLRYKC